MREQSRVLGGNGWNIVQHLKIDTNEQHAAPHKGNLFV